MWVVRDGEVLRILTDPASGKVRRLRANPAVRLSPCDMRGRVKPDAVVAEASVELDDEAGTQRTMALIEKRYGLMGRILGWLNSRKARKAAGGEIRHIGLRVTARMSEARVRSAIDKAAADRRTGEVLWRVRSDDGELDVTYGDPSRPFFLASATKLATSAILAQLRIEKRLDWDAPVAPLLPDLDLSGLSMDGGRDRSQEMTVRELLAHTSGIADYFEGRRKGRPTTFDRVTESDMGWTVSDAVRVDPRSRARHPWSRALLGHRVPAAGRPDREARGHDLRRRRASADRGAPRARRHLRVRRGDVGALRRDRPDAPR